MADIYGVQFDEVNDYFNLQDNADWDIVRSNGSQFYAFWLEVDDNTGSFFQYFFSNGNFGAANSINCFFSEASAGQPNLLQVRPQNVNEQPFDTLTFPTGKIFVVVQYDSVSGFLELVWCPENGTATRAQGSNALSGDITSSVWNLGRRTDGNADRYYGGIIYNLAKGNTLLTNTQIESLATSLLNYDPADEFTPVIYYPMNEGTGTNITDDVLGLTGTGVGFPGDDSQWVFVGSTGSTLVADSGTYTYTGTDAQLLLARTLEANSGTYNYTGTDASLIAGARLEANSGTYALTGSDAQLLKGNRLDAQAGSYTYTGTAVDLIYTPNTGFTLEAESGTYAYTGQDVNFSRDRVIIASSGTYSYNGSDISLVLPGQIWTDKPKVSTSWGDKAPVVTAWGDKAPVNTIWTDK